MVSSELQMTSAENLLLEQETHEVITVWVSEHEVTTDGLITAVPYDRAKRPYQRLDVPVLPYQSPDMDIPEHILMPKIEDTFCKIFGEHGKEMIEDFRNYPTSETDPRPLVKTIEQMLDDKKNVAIVTAHGVYDDILQIMGALTIAKGRADQMANNTVLINKVMSREAYNGYPMIEAISQIAHAVMIFPSKEGALERGIPNKAYEDVCRFGMTSLIQFIKKGGTLSTIAPAGSALKLNKGKTGYYIPTLEPGSANLLSRYDALLPVALWRDPETGKVTWKINDLIVPVQHPDNAAKKASAPALTDFVIKQIATDMAELIGKPVAYTKLAA